MRVSPKLLEVRGKRPPPLTDRKVLTAWNGLAISAFARAGFAFARPGLIERAARAASMLLEKHRDAQGNLMRSSLEGNPRHAGLLEDHAFLAAGLVDLFEATGDARWLHDSLALHQALEARFADTDGGYFRAPLGHETLLAREKPAYDGAEPTGNSVAALTLFRLANLTGDPLHADRARRLLRSFGTMLGGSPLALGEMLLALEFAHGTPRELVLVRAQGGSDQQLLELVRGRFAPHLSIVRAEEGAAMEAIAKDSLLVIDRRALGGLATAYLCREGACGLPATSAAVLTDQLRQL